MSGERRRRIFSSNHPKVTNTVVTIPSNRTMNKKKSVIPYKISYCTTCYNRFWQLKQVIKHNITVINNNGPAEWIIIDFNGKDSPQIEEWLKINCPKSLAKGTLKYYRRDPELGPFVWNVSVAKNVAHRLATGEILVNLDGDNYLQQNDPEILRGFFSHNPDLILHQTWNNFLIANNMRSLGRHKIAYAPFLEQYTGSNGRISMSQKNFKRLGGYDEEMLFMGFQDTDILARAILKGFSYLAKPPKKLSVRYKANNKFKHSLPYKGASTDDSIGNQRTEPYSNNKIKSWKQAEAHNRHLSFRKIKQGKLVANETGYQETLDSYLRIANEEKSFSK